MDTHTPTYNKHILENYTDFSHFFILSLFFKIIVYILD